MQLSVVCRHRHDGDALLEHDAPGAVHRHGGVERGRRVKVQIAHLRAHVGDRHRRLKAEAVEHAARLVVDVVEVRRHIFAAAERVLQRGVAHGRHDRIGVRVAVACHINFIHEAEAPFYRFRKCSQNDYSFVTIIVDKDRLSRVFCKHFV